jgi:hypothetical protein
MRLMRWLVVVNLGLVALQAVSAGLFLSGYGRAATFHSMTAHALQAGALIQAITAIVLWRRGRLAGRMAGIGLALFLIVFLQVGLGHRKVFWLHVPIGVGLFGGLTRQVGRP